MEKTHEPLDVIAVAPHPDDLEILCGGTLAKLVRQGYRVGMVDLTIGEPTPRGTPETRAAEAEEARRILGVPVRINLKLPNRELMDSPAARYALATILRQYRPRILMMMHGRTVLASPDHYQAQLIAEASRFYSQLTKWDDRFDGTPPHPIPHLVFVPVGHDAEVTHFHSRFCVDVTETIEQKLAAIKAYKSQFDEKRVVNMEHWIRSTNGVHGARIGVKYAEQFALPRPLAMPDLVAGLFPLDPLKIPPGPT